MFGKMKALLLSLILVLVIAISAPTAAFADEGEYPRFAGKDRYETAFAIAEYIRSFNEDGQFSCITVAYGENYPDALSAGYLATSINTPLLLINPEKEDQVFDYIKKYAQRDAIVYIVGGPSVVSERFEKKIIDAGYTALRLGGANRYETNLKVLYYAVDPDTLTPRNLIIATGKNFPDALCASSVWQCSLMLVTDELFDYQIEWIKENDIQDIYIVGGTSAVSQKVEDELKKYKEQTTYGSVYRLAGANRWETSIKVAEVFSGSSTAILATGLNYPDALTASTLVEKTLSPIILVGENNWQHAKKSIGDNRFSKVMVVGGPSAVSDALVEKILASWNQE